MWFTSSTLFCDTVECFCYGYDPFFWPSLLLVIINGFWWPIAVANFHGVIIMVTMGYSYAFRQLPSRENIIACWLPYNPYYLSNNDQLLMVKSVIGIGLHVLLLCESKTSILYDLVPYGDPTLASVVHFLITWNSNVMCTPLRCRGSILPWSTK